MITKNIGEEFTLQELQGETSRINNGVTITVYHGDEPEQEPQEPVLQPDWLGLEQSFVYSPLFTTVAGSSTRSDFWWEMIKSTIANGKRGEASQNFLYEALLKLGVEWTNNERLQLNQMLTNNNFTIQI